MPRFDGTGPLGYGPGTGWGLGPCGTGMGYGRRTAGRGLGWRRFWGASNQDEKAMLSEEAERKTLENIILEKFSI